MNKINVEYKGGDTLFTSDNIGIITRLLIVLNEKGYNIKIHEDCICIENKLIRYDDIRSIINNDFNPEVIELNIIGDGN